MALARHISYLCGCLGDAPQRDWRENVAWLSRSVRAAWHPPDLGELAEPIDDHYEGKEEEEDWTSESNEERLGELAPSWRWPLHDSCHACARASPPRRMRGTDRHIMEGEGSIPPRNRRLRLAMTACVEDGDILGVLPGPKGRGRWPTTCLGW